MKTNKEIKQTNPLYLIWESPIGKLLLCKTSHGLARIAFENEDHEAVLSKLESQLDQKPIHDPTAFDLEIKQLMQYFDKKRQSFNLPIDLCLISTDFKRNVVATLQDINYGDTASYSQLAALLGHDKAVRAVGTACAKNPLPIIYPCHRVVKTDGNIGQYLGGTSAKKYLLSLESGG